MTMRRTSVALDKEVVASIEAEAIAEERPFSQIVNRKLRLAFGMQSPTTTAPKPAPPRRRKVAEPASK